jgi:hypothetical protein
MLAGLFPCLSWSGLYAGIHFRSACRDGIKLGEQIGRRAFAQHLLPYRD